MTTGKVVAIIRSVKKGVPKEKLETANFIQGYGMEGDLHAGKSGRHVSFLGIESHRAIDEADVKGFCTSKFVENITTEGIELWRLPEGTNLRIGKTVMKVTGIGKACYRGCPVSEQAGSCVILKQVVFADVIEGGEIATGDSIEILNAKECKG